MKRITLIGLLAICTAFSAQAQLGKKMLEKAAKSAAPDAPEGNEATVKMFADAARTQEITTISDGMTKVYFRAYIWKSMSKKGSSPYKPMSGEYCLSLHEGEFQREDALKGSSFAEVKSSLEGGKNFATWVKNSDYLDLDVDLTDHEYLDNFIQYATEKKTYPFTVRLEGECKFTLANGTFGVDLSAGKPKYDALLVAANDDIEIKPDLYPNDTKLHEFTTRLLASTYGLKEFEKLHFYKDWELMSGGSERKINTLVTYQENGNCFVTYVKVWEKLLPNGNWSDPYAVNQRANFQVNCDKIK